MIAPGGKRIAFYLRSGGNLHYFAAIKPYLDHFLRAGGYDNALVVREWSRACDRAPEYEGYRHLFSTDAELEQYDLVITPTHLRDNEISTRENAVQVFHGISDKPFTYQRDFSDYALCLCAGQRQVDRLLRYDHNRLMNWRLVGYPKLDDIPYLPPLFANNKRTVIYCPTWRKGGLSSVELMLDHLPVIESIAADYNLIVKPHPNLFNAAREFFDVRLVDRLEAVPDILLVRSGNVLPWMAQADLFLGDISATGYEWLYFGRPAVFLNPQPGVFHTGAAVDDLTYLWQCGEVCDNIWKLKRCIDRNFAEDAFLAQRERILHYSVHCPRARGATARGVAEIEALLVQGAPPRYGRSKLELRAESR